MFGPRKGCSATRSNCKFNSMFGVLLATKKAAPAPGSWAADHPATQVSPGSSDVLGLATRFRLSYYGAQ